MKRIGWVLLSAAAWILFCGVAQAADTIPPLSTEVEDHLWLMIFAGILPPIVKALNEGTLKLPTVVAPKRLLIIAILSSIATSIDLLVNGASIRNALSALAISAGPSLLIEAVHYQWGGWKLATVSEGPKSSGGGPGPIIITIPPPPGGGAIPSFPPPPATQATPPPPLTSVKMGTLAALSLGIALFAFGCAALPYACPILKLASSVCDTVIVEFPDGTQERVPKDQIAGLAMQARSARLGLANPVDGGVLKADAGTGVSR